MHIVDDAIAALRSWSVVMRQFGQAGADKIQREDAEAKRTRLAATGTV